MGPALAMGLCLAYILGLLSTAVWWGGWAMLAGAIGAGIVVPRRWRQAPRTRIWLVLGGVGLLASFYFHIRVPQPASNDISRWISSKTESTLTVQVQGRVESLPRLTRSKKAQFWLQVRQAEPIDRVDPEIDFSKPVQGRLYVTAPIAGAIDLHPGQWVEVTGALYRPQPATNPGGFDFQKFLQQEGCFAGLRGKRVKVPEQSRRWGWWRVQQQIVRSQAQWLTRTEGALVSSMVLGSRGVDLPSDLKAQFTQVGLAHALAASGFQTSLILGVVLALTRRCSGKVQFLAGSLALGIFVSLTGAQPAVLRAAFMGFGGLVALLVQRRVKPLGLMLVAATLLLLYNPLWIWNLGFQLSFLATLGLLVTVPPLSKKLDWLPGAIVPMLAVPIAAYLWTLPLLLFAFGVLSPYTIPVNLVTTPLISIISLGGMGSALAALIWSPAGSALAWVLKYPTQILMAIVHFFAQLPGNAYAVGTISVLTVISLYALIGLTWLTPWWRKRWWLACLLAIALVIVPLWQSRANLLRVTVLATSNQPVVVIQDGANTTLINSGDASTANFSILPFLQKEGINTISWAIATEASGISSGWGEVMRRLPIKTFYSTPQAAAATAPKGTRLPVSVQPMPLQQPLQLGNLQLTQLNQNPVMIALTLEGKTWLVAGNLTREQQQQLPTPPAFSPAQILLWSGDRPLPDSLTTLQPEVVIVAGSEVDRETSRQLRDQNIQLLTTAREGAIQWTRKEGFRSTLETPREDI